MSIMRRHEIKQKLREEAVNLIMYEKVWKSLVCRALLQILEDLEKIEERLEKLERR